MANKIALKLVKKESQKNKGKYFFKLFLDFGYREQVVVPYDDTLVISILDCPMSTLYDLCEKVDEPVVVAYLDFNID